MTVHKFSVGQHVRFNSGSRGLAHLNGSYTVVRQLPSETRDLQYRVKSDRDSHERIVNESQLSVGAAPAMAGGDWASN